MDEALCVGANDEHSRLIICAYFMKDKPDNAAFLQRHYGENGAGFYFDGEKVSLWYDAEGMRIARGSTAQRSNATLISWEEAAKRIRELLDLGRYMPQSELDEVEHYERMQLADSIAYTSRDITNGSDGRQAFCRWPCWLIPSRAAIRKCRSRFMAFSVSRIPCKSAWTNGRRSTLRWMPGKTFCVFAFTVRKRYWSGSVIYNGSRCILPLPTGLLPTGSFLFPPTRSTRCCVEGSGSTDYRLGVYAFTPPTRIRPSGKNTSRIITVSTAVTSGGNDNITHTRGKGIEFSHGSITAPYAKVTLKWPEAAKRIGELISQNKFLSDADWAAMPKYEQEQLARKIVNFFMDTPEDVVRPFSQNAIADYWECIKAVSRTAFGRRPGAGNLSEYAPCLGIHESGRPAL
ncbi:MAG: hypothetical protein ACLUS6_11905 [Dysosmobacter sp.]